MLTRTAQPPRSHARCSFARKVAARTSARIAAELERGCRPACASRPCQACDGSCAAPSGKPTQAKRSHEQCTRRMQAEALEPDARAPTRAGQLPVPRAGSACRSGLRPAEQEPRVVSATLNLRPARCGSHSPRTNPLSARNCGETPSPAPPGKPPSARTGGGEQSRSVLACAARSVAQLAGQSARCQPALPCRVSRRVLAPRRAPRGFRGVVRASGAAVGRPCTAGALRDAEPENAADVAGNCPT